MAWRIFFYLKPFRRDWRAWRTDFTIANAAFHYAARPKSCSDKERRRSDVYAEDSTTWFGRNSPSSVCLFCVIFRINVPMTSVNCRSFGALSVSSFEGTCLELRRIPPTSNCEGALTLVVILRRAQHVSAWQVLSGPHSSIQARSAASSSTCVKRQYTSWSRR